LETSVVISRSSPQLYLGWNAKAAALDIPTVVKVAEAAAANARRFLEAEEQVS
jgi:hypothetical protein